MKSFSFWDIEVMEQEQTSIRSPLHSLFHKETFWVVLTTQISSRTINTHFDAATRSRAIRI